MPDRPRFPIAYLVAWLAVVVDVAGLVWLFLSHQPLWLKLAIGGAEVIGACVIFAFYLGRLREWTRSTRHVRDLERELQRPSS